MSIKRRTQSAASIQALLGGEQVRRAQYKGQTCYAAVDVVSLLTAPQHGPQVWAEMKTREPELLQHLVPANFPSIDGFADTDEGVSSEGLLRLIQSVPSARSARLKNWLARTARRSLAEARNPELLALRARRLYEHRGYSRRWVDKRLRGISAR